MSRSGGFGETWPEPPGRAARPESGSSVAPVMVITGAPCVRGPRTSIAPRRRATFRQTLLAPSRALLSQPLADLARRRAQLSVLLVVVCDRAQEQDRLALR